MPRVERRLTAKGWGIWELSGGDNILLLNCGMVTWLYIFVKIYGIILKIGEIYYMYMISLKMVFKNRATH